MFKSLGREEADRLCEGHGQRRTVAAMPGLDFDQDSLLFERRDPVRNEEPRRLDGIRPEAEEASGELCDCPIGIDERRLPNRDEGAQRQRQPPTDWPGVEQDPVATRQIGRAHV